MYERPNINYGLAQQRPDEDEWPPSGDDWEPARDMPELEDVQKRISEMEDEIRAKGKVPLTGHIIMACHTLPYVCNLRRTGPQSPSLPIEIQPGDSVTMPQGLHSPTSNPLLEPTEPWPALDQLVNGTNEEENPESRTTNGNRTSTPPAKELNEETPAPTAGLKALAATQARLQGTSFTPSRPPSPNSMKLLSSAAKANGVIQASDIPPTTTITNANLQPTAAPLDDQYRWVLQPRRGHAALNAGIRSLADRQLTLVAWPGDLRNSEGGHIDAAALTEEQKSALDQGLARLAKEGEEHPVSDGVPASGEDSNAITRKGIKCSPVWLEDKDAALHYEGYCKGYLWPLFHYLPLSEHQDKNAEIAAWKAYEQVNMAFAKRVAEIYKPGDLIWIQDYHLLLVPSMLKKMLPDCHIGLFLHSPFPSSEFFRCLPRREAILDGMLGADLLCFQTYSYGRHFVSACIRVMGYESVGDGIEANGTHTTITHCPIGIDADRIEADRRTQGVTPKIQALRKLYEGKKIVIGRDKLDPTKGVLPKLRAFEELLRRYPKWRGEVVLIQVTTPSPTDSPHLAAKISELVDHINGTYGTLHFSPVHHYHQMIERDEYFALLSVADLAVITSIRDGMNTLSMEYTICQANEGAANPLILSEFTGVTGSMKAAIKVNPWDLGGVAAAMDQCLNMSPEEKKVRHERLYSRVKSHSSAVWANTLILQLLYCLRKDDTADAVALLDENLLYEKYCGAEKRLLLFDYDGTLTPIVKNPLDAVPPPGLIEALSTLAKDPKNITYIISGRDSAFLQEHLGHIDNLGMSAEHGCFLREPEDTEWTNLTEDIDMSWMDDVEEIFKYYAARTLGAMVEKKVSSVTWHYRNADPEFGLFQAKECQALLESMQERLPIDVLVGKKNLEVRPAHTNKGEIVKRLLYSSPEVGFALCAGDDKTDEDMFRALRSLGNSCPDNQQPTIPPPQTLSLFPTLARTTSLSGRSRSRGSSCEPPESPKAGRRRFSGTSVPSANGTSYAPKLEPVQSELDPKGIFSVMVDTNEHRKTMADHRIGTPFELITVLGKLAEASR